MATLYCQVKNNIFGIIVKENAAPDYQERPCLSDIALQIVALQQPPLHKARISMQDVEKLQILG
jgi:hypothetical protein